jgi:hypothetical protein
MSPNRVQLSDQPGSASHSKGYFRFSIADCQLIKIAPLANLVRGIMKIGNRQSEIGNAYVL